MSSPHLVVNISTTYRSDFVTNESLHEWSLLEHKAFNTNIIDKQNNGNQILQENEHEKSTLKVLQTSEKMEESTRQSREKIVSPSSRSRPFVESSKSNDDYSDECSAMLYQCRPDCTNRLDSPCSCKIHCQKEGNCCNDFVHKCVSAPKKTPWTQCVDNHVTVTSCDERFDQGSLEDLKRRLAKSTLTRFLDNRSFQDIQDGCSSSQDIFQSLPVTDKVRSVHYKNVFCAICHNVSEVQFWTGYLNCPNIPKTTPYQMSENMNNAALAFLATMTEKKFVHSLNEWKCLAILQPRQTDGQLCFELDNTTKVYRRSNILVLKLPDVTKHAVQFRVFRFHLSELPERAVKFSSQTSNILDLVNVEELNTTLALGDKCAQIRPYLHLCHDCDQHTLYWYCSMLKQKTVQVPCYDSVSYSYIAHSKYYVIKTSPASNDREEDEVSSMFQLRLAMKYTFQTNRVIRGNVKTQMEQISRSLTSAVITSSHAFQFSCNLSKDELSAETQNHEYTSYLYFGCQDDGKNLTDNETQTSKDVADSKVNKLIKFGELCMTGLPNIPVRLPLTVNTAICIILPQTKYPEGFCSKNNMKWSAVRKKNAVLNGLSLEGIITIICCALSIMGLLLRLAFQNIVAVYKSYPGKVQFSLCFSLLLSYTFFLVGGMVEDGSLECKVVGMLTHLAFLSALFWMNVTAFEIWRTFRHWSHQVVARGSTSLLVASLYAIGIPSMIVVGALLVEEFLPLSNFSPEYGIHNCWLNGGVAVAIYFIIPCSVLCCSNVLFVGLTLR
ncbi:G-protein coupled receptor Mth-like 1, partial [Biomphalaria pfeifferi]